MGAGKTTLIKAICTALGSKNSMSSPSFSIVNEYESPAGRLFHFDLYRIKNPEELLDIGIEEYLDSGHYCFFEWPEMVLPFVENPVIKLKISVADNIRYIRLTHNNE
jgi:tRNA threonylcarbamoyladenosine biosynthesis protein TsaE